MVGLVLKADLSTINLSSLSREVNHTQNFSVSLLKSLTLLSAFPNCFLPPFKNRNYLFQTDRMFPLIYYQKRQSQLSLFTKEACHSAKTAI